MFIDTDSIKVNNISLGPYLVEAKYSYNKLWGKDTGRNLAGTNSGTLIGIFPKIVCQFRKLTKSELEYLVPIFDSPTQNLRYYDPNKKAYVTMSTYTGDYEITNRYIINNESYNNAHKNLGFSISFIANKKRS